MKTNSLLIFLTFLAHVTLNAGTVNFSNFNSGLEVQSDGKPISGGFVAVGTTSDPNSYSDPDLLEESFIQFGESSSFGGSSAFNLDGFFSGVAISDGGASEFLGKRIFLIGGEGQSIADSESLFLIDTGADFAADSPIFAASVDLTSGTVLLGDQSGQASISGSSGAFQAQSFESFTIIDQNFELIENSEKGKVVGTINTSNDIQFTIVENFNSNNDDNPAFIITDNELILNDPEDIDYETQATITLRFNGSLSSEESDEASILITILDDLSEDNDGDGLNQDQEISIGTSDFSKDTDNDGFDDGTEVAIGTDPTDESSNPGLVEAQNLIKELEEKNKLLTDSITEKDSLIVSINENLISKGSEITDLNTQVNSLNDSIAQKDNTISSLEDSLTTKTQQISSLNESITLKNSEITNLNTQVNSLNDSITQKDNTISSLEDSLTTKTQQISTLNESITLKNSEITDLNTQVNSLNDSIAQKDNTISSLEGSLTTKTQQISTLNDEINDAQNLITEKETKIEGLNNQIQILSSTIEDSENQSTVIASLNSTIESKNSELNELNSLYQSKCTEVATLNDEIDLLNESIIDKIIEIGKLCERPSLDEIQEGRIGSVVLRPNLNDNTITINLAIEESPDLIEWKPIDQIISTTLPLDEDKKFYRFAAE